MLPETVQTPVFMLKRSVVSHLFVWLCLLPGIFTTVGVASAGCVGAGKWATPDDQGALPTSASHVLESASNADFVLLGESHDNISHHLWQLQSMSMLLGVRDQMVIGMEMFPRRAQPALDRWIDGELTETELLQQTDWNRVWGYDPEFYLPILRFARMNRIPLVALNVDRTLISQTGASGWAGVAPEQREGVGEPASASDAYRAFLRESFQQHGEPDESQFEHFVQAQLVWDRAFAEALAQAASAHPQALVVGVIGSGHLRYGYGVPHQLRSMGRQDFRVWLPTEAAGQCESLVSIADAVFGIDDYRRDPAVRLGIYLEDTNEGTEIRGVQPDSVAASAGLLKGDRILTAAGIQINVGADVIAIVHRQPPGTWLPLTIARDGKTMQVVAKFPPLAPN